MHRKDNQVCWPLANHLARIGEPQNSRLLFPISWHLEIRDCHCKVHTTNIQSFKLVRGICDHVYVPLHPRTSKHLWGYKKDVLISKLNAYHLQISSHCEHQVYHFHHRWWVCFCSPNIHHFHQSKSYHKCESRSIQHMNGKYNQCQGYAHTGSFLASACLENNEHYTPNTDISS